jgi:hypothetical protein
MPVIKTNLDSCFVTVTIPAATPEQSDTWCYHSPFLVGKTLRFPLEVRWVVFGLDEVTAKTFAFLAPEGVEGNRNWEVYSWSANAVIVRDNQMDIIGNSGKKDTFTLWVEQSQNPGHFYSGGPEVTNTGDPDDICC